MFVCGGHNFIKNKHPPPLQVSYKDCSSTEFNSVPMAHLLSWACLREQCYLLHPQASQGLWLEIGVSFYFSCM